MTEREAFLRAFHAANPAATSRALARGGSYERLAARTAVHLDQLAVGVAGGRVLDLGCGDGHLLRLLGPRAIGIDIAIEDLYIAQRGPEPTWAPAVVAQARAQALPFADRSFDAITCHLAFMLFDDLDQVVGGLARVLRPGGPFIALLGGGPTAHGNDAFHAFASLLPQGRALGDRRASSEAGWRELFDARDWRDLRFERWELDLSGTFEEVWTFLGASYQLADPRHSDHSGVPIRGTATPDSVRDADKRHDLHISQVGPISEVLRKQFPGQRVPLSIATYCATAIRR